MTIQAEGNYEKAKALGDRLGNVRPPVQRLLDRLASVPVDIEPNFVTAVPGRAEISIDMRALDADVLAKLLVGTKKASLAAAKEFKVKVEWSPILEITPRLFDDEAHYSLAIRRRREILAALLAAE